VTEINSSTFNSPCGISYDGTNVWVANQTGGSDGNGSVSEIDVATGAVTEIDSSTFNEPMAITANGSGAWVANGYGGTDGNGSVSKINITTGAVTQINSSTFNDMSSIAADSSNVWAASLIGGEDGSVSKINITTGAVTKVTSSTFSFPEGIASDGTNVWVANSAGGTDDNGSLSEINVASGTVTTTNDPSINSPVGVALTGPDVWVANQMGGTNGVGSVTEIVPSSSTSGSGSTTGSVPGAPIALHATAGAASAALTWKAPSSDGGSTISSYVATSKPGGKTCTTTATSCSVSGLEAGVWYTFTVVANNDTGRSKASKVSNKVKPKAKAKPTPVTHPYDGQWSGTFTFTLNLPVVQVDYYVTNPAESVVVTVPLTVDVTNGVVVVADAGTDDNNNVYDFEQSVNDRATVTPTGLATFSDMGGMSSVNEVTTDDTAYFGDPGMGESGCSAAIQFTGTTAVSPGPISCDGVDDFGNAASITGGKITLSLASTTTVLP
jgi:hypothetical protein